LPGGVLLSVEQEEGGLGGSYERKRDELVQDLADYARIEVNNVSGRAANDTRVRLPCLMLMPRLTLRAPTCIGL
jgi:hypothetical protein